MSTARNYVTDIIINTEQALARMPLVIVPVRRTLPATPEDISRYVEQLLTPEEQRICDMATD